MLAHTNRIAFDEDLIRSTIEGIESQVRVGTRIASKTR
jgi:hypothetical protein